MQTEDMTPERLVAIANEAATAMNRYPIGWPVGELTFAELDARWLECYNELERRNMHEYIIEHMLAPE